MLSVLGQYWRQYPDLRLGQIVGNLSGSVDPFFVEDNVLYEEMRDTLDVNASIARMGKDA